MLRRRVGFGFGLLFGACLAACADLGPLPADDHVVAAPISDRAGVVLSQLVALGLRGDTWCEQMSPGCATIFATQFGYRCGQRRDREDLLRLGELTADLEAASFRGLAWGALFGDVATDHPAVPGFPALLVSAAVGQRSGHAFWFEVGLDRLLERASAMPLRPNQAAGLALMLAEVARCEPEQREQRLLQARQFAEGIDPSGQLPFHVMAWAAVARTSGDAADLARAEAFAARAMPRFETESGVPLLPAEENYADVLSLHLALIHAWCDLAQAGAAGRPRESALRLLDYVFSDFYFDGHFLAHDRGNGRRSAAFCSGCNFFALYLADRLYGDSLVLPPVPEPERVEVEEPTEVACAPISMALFADGKPVPVRVPELDLDLKLTLAVESEATETEADAPARWRLRLFLPAERVVPTTPSFCFWILASDDLGAWLPEIGFSLLEGEVRFLPTLERDGSAFSIDLKVRLISISDSP